MPMPGYDDQLRARPPAARAKSLVDSAVTLANNKWMGRSWTEVGWSVAGGAGSGGKWVAGQGMKITINNVAGLFGPVAEWASGKELSELAGSVGASVVEQVWPLVEDQIKNKMEDGGTAAVGMAFPTVTAQVSAGLRQELKDKDPKEKSEKLQTTISELCVRSATLPKRLKIPSFDYCDDVYYCALESCQIEALRTESIQLIGSLKSDLDALKTAIDQLNMTGIKDAITTAAVAKTADNSTVSHNNHYRMNVFSARKSCSLQHCFGKKP
jgi:hypothetical protein